MKQQLLEITFIYIVLQIKAQCTNKPTQALEPLVLYSLGDPGHGNYSHILSPHPEFESYASSGGLQVRYAYQLDARALTSNDNTGCSCVKSLVTIVKSALLEGRLSISHAPNEYIPYWVSSGYEVLSYNTFFCVSNAGDCGASTPLYLYKNNDTDEYYVSTEDKGPELNETPYSYSYPPIRPDLYLVPLCYVWLDTTLTTTTVTTTVLTTLYTTENDNVAITSNESIYDSTDTTSSTVLSASSTIIENNDSDNSSTESITGTSSSSTIKPTTTNIFGSGETPPTEETKEKETKKRQWWKWLVGIAGGLILVGLFIFVLSCCTVLFISPAKNKDSVVKYSSETSSSANVLPPQPIQASTAGQQLSSAVVPSLLPGYVPA